MQLNLPWRHDGPMAGRPPSDIAGRFPNRVRALRTDAGLTQEELAKRLHVTTSAIGKLERGATRLRTDQMQRLAGIFHCHPVELILPLSAEEREALQLVGAATGPMRKRMIQMLRMLVEPMPSATEKAA